MKFKKSDLGLYFASSLVGAGVGLLVGALVASRLAGPEPVYIPEPLEDPVAKRNQVENVEEYLDEQEERVEKIVQEKKPRKKTIKIQAQDDPELAAFIAEWEPSTIQIEMVKKKLVTLKDLEELLIKENLSALAEPYNYSAPYYDKPELVDIAKLPEEEEIVDSRYQILREPPADKDAKNLREIHWDPEDDTFYTLTRKQQPVPTDLRGVISDETWVALVPYFDKGYSTLYVDDLETSRFYKFVVVPNDMEDSLGNDHGPNQ